MSWTGYPQSTMNHSILLNRGLDEIEEGLVSARTRLVSERRRMRSELSRVHGTLEQRLDRVSATLDAFIELSDIRATPSVLDDAAMIPHRTLQMLDGAPVPHLETDDVPRVVARPHCPRPAARDHWPSPTAPTCAH